MIFLYTSTYKKVQILQCCKNEVHRLKACKVTSFLQFMKKRFHLNAVFVIQNLMKNLFMEKEGEPLNKEPVMTYTAKTVIRVNFIFFFLECPMTLIMGRLLL